jgi:hypothetical protein
MTQLKQGEGWLDLVKQALLKQPKWRLAIGATVGVIAGGWLAWQLLKLSLYALQILLVLLVIVLVWVVLPALYFWSWWRLFKQQRDKGVNVKRMVGWSILAQVFLFFVPFAPHLMLLAAGQEPKGALRRGTNLVAATQLQRLLQARQASLPPDRVALPLLEIGGIEMPSDLENLGFFFVGSPGSGKTQAIKRLLAILKERSDFRVMVLDRNGELLESFFDAERDLLFNPKDARWSTTDRSDYLVCQVVQH